MEQQRPATTGADIKFRSDPMTVDVLLLLLAAALADDESHCTEELQGGESCKIAYARGVPCHALYRRFRCCRDCDPCGIDGSLCSERRERPGWVSPTCACDRVVITGACSYNGCAKPDAIGVFARQRGWRTADGRHVYVKEAEQPAQLHHEALSHGTVDASSGANTSVESVYLCQWRRYPELTAWFSTRPARPAHPALIVDSSPAWARVPSAQTI